MVSGAFERGEVSIYMHTITVGAAWLGGDLGHGHAGEESEGGDELHDDIWNLSTRRDEL